MDRDEFIRQQLSIAHAAIKAAFLLLENEEESPPSECECQHINKTDLTTMGGVNWICRDCGFEFNQEGGENT